MCERMTPTGAGAPEERSMRAFRTSLLLFSLSTLGACGARTVLDGETDDAMEAVEEGMTYIPPIDPPTVNSRCSATPSKAMCVVTPT